MAVKPDLFQAWKQRPPAFLVHLDAGGSKGSAVQVDELHVVTCAHVFGRDEENFYQSEGLIDSVIQRHALVWSRGFESEGTVIAQHESLDLALVRLKKPRPNVAPPLLLDESHRGDAWAAGVRRAADRLECLQQEIVIKDTVYSGDMPILDRYDFGPLEGTSGGGVFATWKGRLVLVGIAHLGGERHRMGGLIPSKAVLDFLRKALDFKNPAASTADHEAALLEDGIVPAREVEAKGYPFKLVFAAIMMKADRPGATVSFVSRRAIAASEMRIRTPARVLPGHHRLAAWAGRIEQADAAIQAIGGALGLKLRLPTVEELVFSWRAPPTARPPEGRPLTLADFRANELRIQVPPAGVYEWARDRNGDGYAVEAGVEPGSVQSIPDAEVGAIAPCFRAAFDAEGV
jgi:hypothetical protein